MNLAPIVDRLQAEIPGLKRVAGTGSFLDAVERLTIAPAAFVLPLNETGGASRIGTGVVRQPLTFGFGVLLALRVPGAAEQRQLDELTPLRAALKAALIGWLHPAATAPCLFAAGRLLALGDGRVLWWQDEFTAEGIHRS